MSAANADALRDAPWRHAFLGDIYDIGSSKRVLRRQWKSTGVPFYRAREIVKLAQSGSVDNELFISEEHFEELKSKTGVPQPGDLMVSAVGTLGACYVVQEGDRFYFKDASVLWFRPRVEVEPRFVQYAFLSDDLLKRVKSSDGATVGTFTISRARNTEIALPPLDEQKRIVAVLDQAFAALDGATGLIRANFADAENLFTNYLANVFSGGGNGWQACSVGDAITLQRGFDITKKHQKPGKYPVVSSSGPQSFHNEAKAAAPGVVVGRKGSIGAVHYIEHDYWPHDTTLFVKDFKENDPLLVFYLLRGLKLSEFDTGAANPSLNRNLVHPIHIRWPERSRQADIAAKLRHLERKANGLRETYESRLADLSNLRRSLLQEAFAGKLA